MGKTPINVRLMCSGFEDFEIRRSVIIFYEYRVKCFNRLKVHMIFSAHEISIQVDGRSTVFLASLILRLCWFYGS